MGSKSGHHREKREQQFHSNPFRTLRKEGENTNHSPSLSGRKGGTAEEKNGQNDLGCPTEKWVSLEAGVCVFYKEGGKGERNQCARVQSSPLHTCYNGQRKREKRRDVTSKVHWVFPLHACRYRRTEFGGSGTKTKKGIKPECGNISRTTEKIWENGETGLRNEIVTCRAVG